MKSRTLSTEPIRRSIRSTASLAPPCSGPYSAAMPAETAEYGSTWLEPDRAHRVGRAVLLVVGVQDEQDLQRLGEPLVGVELLLAHLEQHRQEVLGVGQVVVGVDVRLALRVPERPGAERRHLGDQPDHLDVPVVLVVDVARLGVERRQGPHRRHQHPHRVRVVAEALHERLDVLVHEGVVVISCTHASYWRLVGELAVDQQVGHLEEGGVLGQLLDRVAAVLQDALVAVDVGDGAAARRRVGEARVVGRDAGLVVVGLDRARSPARMVPSVIGSS